MAKKIIKIKGSRLMDIIDRTVDEVVSSKGQLVEGVQYNKEENSFIFDFVHDSERDIIKLTNSGLTKSEINNKCFYFKYQFEDNVNSQLRAKFIEHMKFHEGMNNTDIDTFVKSAVNSLDDTVNLREYNTIIYPQSISEINRKVIAYIRKFGYPDFLSFELVKEPPIELQFDYESYHKVLIIDDVMTSGTTLTHIINTIYRVNPNATVIVFTILGKS